MSKRTTSLYLADIIQCISKIELYIKGVSFEEFSQNPEKIDAVVRNLEIIGEAGKHIPEELKSRHTSIPWRKMISMRNKVTHEYFGVDEEILWQTITEDLLPLKLQLQDLPEFKS